ncbi:hypothetical protein [Ancylobacter mangrovi]|uniref:PepSY domain-containing protein n=1 Tax=Ancylobacter mangrovi TaxID=2972472 RepID=A0A9X2T5C8_9HYPH|nr:hypothetical protein [Ancylobacter mangrovi]MCS0493778.1 hypothetical protein [Ancylobacter mangrovi]MCS0501525.1 hypothetical protein [Ancylobacter mangrovi]
MRRGVAVAASAALMALGAVGSPALAQQNAAGQALQRAVERTCIIEIRSSADAQRIELQNLCYNPRAVRISWGDGRMYDYCLNSSGDVRYVVKLSPNYQLTREQDILLCQ